MMGLANRSNRTVGFFSFWGNNCGTEDLWEKRTERRGRILKARETNRSEDPPLLQRLIGQRVDISDGDEDGRRGRI
jgi:hypothetical protein